MLTDEQELMERLSEIFEVAGQAPILEREPTRLPLSKGSYFQQASNHELGQPSFSLVELYGEQQSLLLNLAENYDRNGRVEYAAVVRGICKLLADPTIQLESTEKPARRLLEWVYPVV